MYAMTEERPASVHTGRFRSVEPKFCSDGAGDHPAGNLVHAGVVQHVFSLNQWPGDTCTQLQRYLVGKLAEQEQIRPRCHPGSVDLLAVAEPLPPRAQQANL